MLPALLVLASLPAASQQRPRPGPFVFVYGLQGGDAVQTARALGCNTIYLDLPLDAPLLLSSVRGWIAEAHQAGLGVIVGLPTILGGEYHVTASNDQYRAALSEWLRAVVGGLRDEPGIIGWATDHDAERAIAYSDEGFRDWLLRRYGSVAALNAAWGTSLPTIMDVDRRDPERLDQEQPYGVGVASVDLAEYHRAACHDVMQLWAQQIRSCGARGLLFTGRIVRYRGLTAVPDDYDVVMPSMPPDVLEADLVSHNVQAVSMGRRGGRFEVVPWLRVPVPPSRAAEDGSLSQWIMEAGLRGAVGVCLEDWSRIAGSRRTQRMVTEQVALALEQQPFLSEPPMPTAAVLYEPYAGGSKKMGTPYGYLPAFDCGEIAAFAWQYRWGTIFGGMDWLCVEDLADIDLDRYGVIFAPLALRLPQEAAELLRSYLLRGGALFADLGLGMYEAGSWAPERGPLGPQLGLLRSMGLEARYGEFRVGAEHPQLPSVQRTMSAHGVFFPGRPTEIAGGVVTGRTFTGPATELKGYPFQGPSCFLNPASTTVPLATMAVRYDDQARPYFLGLFAGEVGAGLGVFASFPAWVYWPVEDELHAALHLDLLRRRARQRLLLPGLLPASLRISGSPQYLHLLNRGEAATVQLLAGAADHRAWLGAIATFSAAEVDPAGRRTGVARLEVEVPARSLVHLQAIPVRLRPYQGECSVRVSCYGPRLIALQVGGQGAVWRARRRGAPSFDGGALTQVRFGIQDGVYPVPPASRHQVIWREGRREPESLLVSADHRGVLDFTLAVAGTEVWVQPATGAPSAGPASRGN